MNVIFLEPGFPANQREFVRALASIGAHVLGVGDRPHEWLDDELKGWLGGYQQIASVTDEGALEWAVRQFQSRLWVDRLEAVVEAHVMPAAHVRERCGIPGTSARTAYLCRDKVAMKEVLRKAGVPTAASAGITGLGEARDFVAGARLSGDPEAARRGRGVGDLPGRATGASSRTRLAASGLADGAPVAIEEFVEGHEGFYDTLAVNGRVAFDFVSHYYPNVLEAMRTRWISPQIVATNRIHEPGYDEVKEMGGAGDRGARHRHLGDAHGVVLRAEGPEVLRDRLPAAGGRAVGQLLRRGRVRPLPRVGDRGLPRDHRPGAVAAATPAASSRCGRTGTAASPATRGPTRSSTATATWWSAAHFPSPGTPTQPVEAGYMANAWMRVRHPDFDELRRILNEIGETVRVHAH